MTLRKTPLMAHVGAAQCEHGFWNCETCRWTRGFADERFEAPRAKVLLEPVGAPIYDTKDFPEPHGIGVGDLLGDQALKQMGGKVRWEYLPMLALEEVAKVRMHGAAKYDTWDWMKGRKWGDYVGALWRHLYRWWYLREDKDKDSGLHHLAHLACTVLFLLEFAMMKVGVDDRPPPYRSSDGE